MKNLKHSSPKIRIFREILALIGPMFVSISVISLYGTSSLNEMS
jgi:hypothetical protein